MSGEKKRIVIISDTHLAGGHDDPLEDHVWQGEPLRRFIEDELGKSAEGQTGDIELIVNGDFLEFVQAFPEAFRAEDRNRGFTEEESLFKLRAILDGHPTIFAALKAFQEDLGNKVTIMAGNHDVDLYWESVQTVLREAAGPLHFELGEDWYERHDGRLHIAHGHQRDPANKFEHWDEPFAFMPSGERCLETCPGTRFVIGFVNPVDARFPFIDNVKPFMRLLWVLVYYDVPGATWAAMLLARFAVKDPGAMLKTSSETGPPNSAFERRQQALRDAMKDDGFMSKLVDLAVDLDFFMTDVDELRPYLRTPDGLVDFLSEILNRGWFDRLPPVPEPAREGNLMSIGADGAEEQGHVLGLARERLLGVVQDLSHAAAERAEKGAEIVVCGHTHVPAYEVEDDYVYYNTGSWTRYLQADEEKNLTLERLQDGEGFPYDLWYVDVRLGEDGILRSARHLFESGTSGANHPEG